MVYCGFVMYRGAQEVPWLEGRGAGASKGSRASPAGRSSSGVEGKAERRPAGDRRQMTRALFFSRSLLPVGLRRLSPVSPPSAHAHPLPNPSPPAALLSPSQTTPSSAPPCPLLMTKIAFLQRKSGGQHHKSPRRGTPHKPKKPHVWVDVDEEDSDLRVKSSKRPHSAQSKHSRASDPPRKKPRLSAPPPSSGKDSLQQQRQELPIYAGRMVSCHFCYYML